MRTICVITGTRAEYGVLRPVLRAIAAHPHLKLSLIVTGMHLSEEFGHTMDYIIQDGFTIDERVDMHPSDDSTRSMAESVGRGIIGLTAALDRIRPEIFLVLGDRTEALAGTIAAAYLNLFIAHISGGDLSRAGRDEAVRHAITKFAHLHFPSTQRSAARIIRMGEDDWRVFPVGAPYLDTVVGMKFPSRDELEQRLKLTLRAPVIVLLQHPVTTEPDDAARDMRETLGAIRELEYQTIIIYSNSDAGGRRMIREITIAERQLPFVRSFKSLGQDDYYALLHHADVLVGNSSSGIIESPAFRIPVVNIGIRQEGRERANNVIDVGHKKDDIIRAIKKALSTEFRQSLQHCVNPYGDGKTGPRIADILATIPLDKKLLQKQNAY